VPATFKAELWMDTVIERWQCLLQVSMLGSKREFGSTHAMSWCILSHLAPLTVLNCLRKQVPLEGHSTEWRSFSY
jgi:hypothetical protein